MYNIRKGWPQDGAIDESVKSGAGLTTDGVIANINNGTAVLGTSDPGVKAFIIGREHYTGKCTALLSDFVVEMDAQHYVAGTYVTGDPMTAATGADAGKFTKGTAANALGHVLSYNATSGMLRVLWDNCVIASA